MPIPYPGQLAALGTASCWVASSLAFDSATRRIGSLTVNILRLAIAAVLLVLLCSVIRGRPFPVDASPRAWMILGVSGLLGFTFGDYCLFRSYLYLGPRLSSVMMALAPPLTALIGWIVLGETLSGRALLGMGLTVAGVSWAILEGHRPAIPAVPAVPANTDAPAAPDDLHPKHPFIGVALGAGGALGQASGLVLSKLGMGSYDPFAATQVRVLAGAAGYVVILSALGWWPRVWRSFADRPAMAATSVGAFFGPFLGVSLSLIAVQRTLTGVAASLMAL
ncbi:MAG TPA: DMT family transporter, partial [Thermoanaerobaculia bacterium]|nr:DMT family transporter [Thermoanaerobaculia bacterium]